MAETCPGRDPKYLELFAPFPTGSTADPFDPESDGRLFISTTGYMAFSFCSDDAAWFGHTGDRDRNLRQCPFPMGYKVLNILERRAIVKNGRVVRTWPGIEHLEEKLQWKSLSQTFMVLKQPTKELEEPHPPHWDPYRPTLWVVRNYENVRLCEGLSYEAALDRAVEYSAENGANPDRPLVVVRFLYSYDWH